MKRPSFFQLATAPIRAGIRWYLRKPRVYSKYGIKVKVLPGIFHPGFFHSTNMLLAYLHQQNLNHKSLLELGCGTGMISILAAKAGATVTATDINELAVENTRLNAIQNGVSIRAMQSNMLESINTERFDWIVINPPYYPRNPASMSDNAWSCGKNHEYFHLLFSQLRSADNHGTHVLIVLSDVCDMPVITRLAGANFFNLEKILEKKVWVDGTNTLYWIKPG